jgi:hypothetical protein
MHTHTRQVVQNRCVMCVTHPSRLCEQKMVTMLAARPSGLCMLQCMRAHIHTHTHTYTHRNIDKHRNTHTYIHTHARTHARTQTRTHARMHASSDTRLGGALRLSTGIPVYTSYLFLFHFKV